MKKRRARKMRKALMMTCCALALVALSVGATLAYLTDTEAVTNTFTVGHVDITLDETDVYEVGDTIPEGKKLGDAKPENTPRVTENKYHLIPGQSYLKDPTVHVEETSEDSYIFVEVVNGLADIEAAGNTTIASQITTNGWTKLEGVDNVYYKEYVKGQGDKDLEVFANFTLMGAGLDNETLANYATAKDANAQIKVTAYAIQKAGFADEKAAWNAGASQGWTSYDVPADAPETPVEP